MEGAYGVISPSEVAQEWVFTALFKRRGVVDVDLHSLWLGMFATLHSCLGYNHLNAFEEEYLGACSRIMKSRIHKCSLLLWIHNALHLIKKALLSYQAQTVINEVV